MDAAETRAAVRPEQTAHCAGAPITDHVLFYCVPDDYVGFDAVSTMPQVYERTAISPSRR